MHPALACEGATLAPRARHCLLAALARLAAWPAAFIAAFLPAPPAHAQILSSAFTYQGQLAFDGAPAQGPYQAEFRLFASTSSTEQLGPTLCADITPVDGTFTVSLDFGALFGGQERYLQIAVRPDNGQDCSFTSPAYTPLSPRQRIAATPNALYAVNANTLNGLSGAFYRNASNINSGILAEAHLPPTAARTNAPSQTFTGVVNFTNSVSISNSASFSVPPAFTNTTLPFSVPNPIRIPNLNADLLDGLNSTAFATASHTHPFSQITGTIAASQLPANLLTTDTSQTITASKVFNGNVLVGSLLQLTIPSAALTLYRDPLNSTPLFEATATNPALGVLTVRPALDIAADRFSGEPGRLRLSDLGGNRNVEFDGSGSGSLRGRLTLDRNSTSNDALANGLVFGNGSGEGISSQRSSPALPNHNGLDLVTAFEPRLSIRNNGDVGIGATNPSFHLEVRGGGNQIGITQPADGDWALRMGIDAINASGDGHGFIALRGQARNEIVYIGRNTTDSGTNPNDGAVQIRKGDGNTVIALYSEAGTGRGVITADAVVARSTLISFGLKAFATPFPDRPGSMIQYTCLEGPEVAAYVRGSAELVNGSATIALPDHFTAIALEDTISVQLTPRSASSTGLAATTVSLDGIEVRELLNGAGSYRFDYLVTAVRRGYRNYSPVAPFPSNIPEDQARDEQARREADDLAPATPAPSISSSLASP